jgi:hypothetical protein
LAKAGGNESSRQNLQIVKAFAETQHGSMTICVGNSNLVIAMPNHLSAEVAKALLIKSIIRWLKPNGNQRNKFIAVCFSRRMLK